VYRAIRATVPRRRNTAKSSTAIEKTAVAAHRMTRPNDARCR
jgi:hypothetical protein